MAISQLFFFKIPPPANQVEDQNKSALLFRNDYHLKSHVALSPVHQVK